MRPRPAGDTDQIAVTIGPETRKFLFWNYTGYRTENHPRQQAMEIWSKAFLEATQPMLVVYPSFEDYPAKFNQGYWYATLADLVQYRTTLLVPSAEIKFLRGVLENPELQDGTKAAYLPRGFRGEKGWLRPFGEIMFEVRYLDKKEILSKIVPELQRTLEAEEGGIICPQPGAGFFCLTTI